MSINPFNQQSNYTSHYYFNWKQLSPHPYNKRDVSPQTRLNILLASIMEGQISQLNSYYASNCKDNDVRRQLALFRRTEWQQSLLTSSLKPIGEELLEHSLAVEQLQIMLALFASKNESNNYVKQAIDFNCIEDCDHLYRLANLFKLNGMDAERVIGRDIDIMPYRPTIAQHRYPIDDVKRYCNYKHSDTATVLNISMLSAINNYAKNLYSHATLHHGDTLGRRLFQELSLVEEQHATLISSLIDPKLTELEWLVLSQYAECYMYYSLCLIEQDSYIHDIWQEMYDIELFHLATASKLLEQHQSTVWQQLVPEGDFPNTIEWKEDNDTLRTNLTENVNLTGKLDD